MIMQELRNIHGGTERHLFSDMPERPYFGMTFRPDGTDAIGTVTKINKTLGGYTVTYTYAHDPNTAHTRPYAEVERMSWKA